MVNTKVEKVSSRPKSRSVLSRTKVEEPKDSTPVSEEVLDKEIEKLVISE